MKTNHLPDKSGFKIPKDYLESFEERLNTQLFLEDKKTSGFKTPDNYLNDFKVTVPQEETSKIIPLFNKKSIIAFTSIAATIALLLTLTINTKQVTFDTLENDNLTAYLIDEVDTNDLSLLLEDLSLNETDFIDLQTDHLEDIIESTDLDDLILE